MKIRLKRHFSVFLALLLLLCTLPVTTYATEISSSDTETAGSAPSVTAPCALLMDAATGTILYEKNSTEERPLASVTKIMTLLLIFQALEAGQIHLEDTVTISEHAAGMGGSQVYLEPNETQTVETLIKCITVASANDACVAMAELISGSEDAFVQKMNETAASLGMTHTNFVNCCGLDADNHYSCANDIALMSRELTVNHPAIFDYTKIWQEGYHSPYCPGRFCLYPQQYEPSDQAVSLCHRTENRFYLQSRFLSLRNRNERFAQSDCSRYGRRKQQRAHCRCEIHVRLGICQLPRVYR